MSVKQSENKALEENVNSALMKFFMPTGQGFYGKMYSYNTVRSLNHKQGARTKHSKQESVIFAEKKRGVTSEM